MYLVPLGTPSLALSEKKSVLKFVCTKVFLFETGSRRS